MSGPHSTAPRLEKKLLIASKNDRNESPRLASSTTGTGILRGRGGQPHQGLVGCDAKAPQAADERHLAVRDLLMNVIGSQQRTGLYLESVGHGEVDVHRRAR